MMRERGIGHLVLWLLVVAMAVSARTAPAATVIVDNADASFSLTGTWQAGSSPASTPYGTDYNWVSTATPADATAEWRPTIPSAGTYEVFVWYGSGGNRANNAPYTIEYDGGSDNVSVNQQSNGGVWFSIGQYAFAAGTSGRVLLNNAAQSGKVVIADAVKFESVGPVVPDLNMAVSPADGGTTTPAVGGPYTKTLNEVVSISAAAAPGYVFERWTVSGGAAVASPTSANTTVTMDVTKTVTAVFVSTLPCSLTMAVTPIGAGTTTPAVGTSSPSCNQSVNISATANSGFVFSHWTTTAGTAVTSPNSASTTVTVDRSKTAIAVFKSTQAADGYIRGLWAVAFHQGYKNSGQIDALVQAAVNGRYNMIIAQMLAYQDAGTNSHGAYWNSSLVPKATDITPSSFDPLAYLCTQAHNNGIQVHVMSVPYRMCTEYPPDRNTILQAHPDWFSVEYPGGGGTVTAVEYSADKFIYVIDPGNPEVQEYLLAIMREWLAYPIDGIHWDLEYAAKGYYPINYSYPNSTLARFKRITGYSGTPTDSNSGWQDFRRRVNTEIVRRAHAEMLGYCTPTRQLRQTASLPMYSPVVSTFSSCTSYEEFNDWELWTRLGYLDTAMPMNYSDSTYKSWIGYEKIWRNKRELAPGLGHYLYSFSTNLAEITWCMNNGTDGIVSYCYWYPTTTNDMTWYTSPTAVRSVFTAPIALPTMKWRAPATATEGTLWGQVVDNTTGLGVDDATVQVGSIAPIKTDGNGYYAVAMANATTAGTSYVVSASKSGYGTFTHNNVQVVAGTVTRDDFGFGTPPPVITQHPLAQNVCTGANVTFTVVATGEGTLTYQWQRDGFNLSNGGRVSGATTSALTIASVDVSNAGNYQCVVTNVGSTTSNAAPLAVQPAVAGDITFDCTVNQADADLFLACMSGAGLPYQGNMPSACTLIPDGQGIIAADFDGDGDVDQDDFGVLQAKLGSQ